MKYIRKNRYVNSLFRQSWVELLNRYEWTWFTTLTFRNLPKTYTAINSTKEWLRTIKKTEKRRIGYFMVMEWTRVQNRPHIHLLMGNLEGVRRDKWWSVWYAQHGAARILPYDKKLGANHYLTKYAVKDVYRSGFFQMRGLKDIG